MKGSILIFAIGVFFALLSGLMVQQASGSTEWGGAVFFGLSAIGWFSKKTGNKGVEK